MLKGAFLFHHFTSRETNSAAYKPGFPATHPYTHTLTHTLTLLSSGFPINMCQLQAEIYKFTNIQPFLT